MKRWISAALPVLGLGLFAVIVISTGPARIVEIFRNADPRRAAIPVALLAAVLLARGGRWRSILARMGMQLSFRRTCELWAVGFFASAVTPAKAGDAVRALYVRNETGRPIGAAFASVFVDRLFDLIFVLASGAVSAVVFSRRYASLPSTGILVACAALVAVVVVAMSRKSVVRALLRPLVALVVPPKYRDGASDSFHEFYDCIGKVTSSRGCVARLAVWTLAGWALIFALAVSVAWTFRIPVDPAYVVVIMPIVTLVELLPVSVSGLGTRDATVIYFFSVVGLERAQAVGFSLGYLVLGTWLTSLLGFAVWVRSPVGLRQGGEGQKKPGPGARLG